MGDEYVSAAVRPLRGEPACEVEVVPGQRGGSQVKGSFKVLNHAIHVNWNKFSFLADFADYLTAKHIVLL